MEPLKLRPALKDYLWGGNRLRDEFGMKSDLDKTAEAWVLSCHKDGENIVENGEFAGKTLSEAIDLMGKECLGENAQKFPYFPVLIKFIDAKDNLSVQVHPDDEYAMRVENEFGKTEAWYILDAQEGAELIYGFRNEISGEEFRRRIEDNTLMDVLNHVKVKKGDLFFIESGTIHAIGKGVLLAEVQQNSNTTYRVYDYGRLGADGKPRELHIEKAVDVTNCVPPKDSGKPQGEPVKKRGYTQTLLISCELFTTYCIDVEESFNDTADNKSFISILVTEGEGTLESCGVSLPLKKGESVFLPAGSGEFALKGKLTVLKTQI